MTNLFQIKKEICEIGERIYKKGFAAANDGNISYRISEKEVVCTPTSISKGFMKPDDLCTVDMEGNQLSGRRKRTSEIKLHLAVMQARSEVKSVVHCHPPHATAFGIAREPVPMCVLPEVEIFLGEVPIAPYDTPGSQTFADTILPFVDKANVVILANHGTVSWGETVEQAYWWTEVLDAYCRMLMLARGLGRIEYLTEPEARALLDLKKEWGMKDPRSELQNCDICANDVFRDSWKATGVQRKAFQPPTYVGKTNAVAANPSGNGQPAAPTSNPADVEQLVQVITDRTDAWSRFPAEPIGSVFLRRAAENEVEAFQAKCPHAGCTIQYQAAKASEESKSDEPLGKFFCPCHAAAFGLAGERLDEVSASPRDMDSLEVDIRDGEVWVTFQNFKMGSSAKEPTA